MSFVTWDILVLLKTILVVIFESESIRRLSNLDDDEVTVSRLEEVVVPLHLDLHLVLHPVDLQKINKASFSDLTLFAFLTTSKWVRVSPLALVARWVGGIVTPPLIKNLTNSLI